MSGSTPKPGAEELGQNEWRGIPSLDQMLSMGGRAGVEYCLISADDLGEMNRMGWTIIPGTHPMTLHGPTGSCDNVLLMGQGKPIEGAAAGNGRRLYYSRPRLLELLGYESGRPIGQAGSSDPTSLRQQTDLNKAIATGAARSKLDQQTQSRTAPSADSTGAGVIR